MAGIRRNPARILDNHTIINQRVDAFPSSLTELCFPWLPDFSVTLFVDYLWFFFVFCGDLCVKLVRVDQPHGNPFVKNAVVNADCVKEMDNRRALKK